MCKDIDDVAGKHIEACDIIYLNINTLIYTAAITLKEHLEEICNMHGNETTIQK